MTIPPQPDSVHLTRAVPSEGAKTALPLHTPGQSAETESLARELDFRAAFVIKRRLAGMTEQADRDEAELLEITRCLDEHPDSYEGPCECASCVSYMAEDHATTGEQS